MAKSQVGSASSSACTLIGSWERTLDRELGKYAIFLQLERQTGRPKTHMVAGLVAGVLFYLVYAMAPEFLLITLTYLYPLFASLQAIESTAGGKAVDAHWLAYWSIVGLVALGECWLGFLVNFPMIPLYRPLKMATFVWMMVPNAGSFGGSGATIVYQTILRPAVAKGMSCCGNWEATSKRLADTINSASELAKEKLAAATAKGSIGKTSPAPNNKDD